MDQNYKSLQSTFGYVSGGIAALTVGLIFIVISQLKSELDAVIYVELAVLIGLVLGSCAIQFYLLKQKVLSPLENVANALDQLASGQLNVSISTGQNNEIGRLGVSAQRVQDFLMETQGHMSNSSSELGQSTRNITEGTRGMGQRIGETHSMSDQIATAMDEMTATAREVSGHATNAADQTHAMNSAVTDGQKSMNDAASAIDRLSHQMDLAVETVRKLAEDSSSVGKVLSVIRGIAEQTNLLALNAAIEAARAGEQGRGFAVVADEVRSLAQKTQESTQEIQVIIENVQNGAKNTTSVMDSSKSITSETQELFTTAGQRLEEIGRSIGELNSLNTHVARAVDEQTSAADSISRDVVRVAQIAEEFKTVQSNMEQACANLEKLSQTNQELERRFTK